MPTVNGIIANKIAFLDHIRTIAAKFARLISDAVEIMRVYVTIVCAGSLFGDRV